MLHQKQLRISNSCGCLWQINTAGFLCRALHPLQCLRLFPQPTHYALLSSPPLSHLTTFVSPRRLRLNPSHQYHLATLSMALPFTPVPAEQVARNIANKMAFVREGLMERGEYLADTTILEKVTWEPHGSGHILTIPRPPLAPDVQEATPPPDGDDRTIADPLEATPPSDRDGSAIADSLEATSVPLAGSPEPTATMPAAQPTAATLSIVTQLMPGQSWLYPDGRWTGKTMYVRRFTDLKLLCTGGAATHPRFTNDYAAAIANLNAIMGQVGDGRNQRNSIVSGPANHIRVRHALFTVRFF